MRGLIKVLIISFLSCGMFLVDSPAQSFFKKNSNEAISFVSVLNCNDSVYSRIIMQYAEDIDSYWSFRIGSSNLLSSCMNNADGIARRVFYNKDRLSLGVFVPLSFRSTLNCGARLGYGFIQNHNYSYSSASYYYQNLYSHNNLKAARSGVCAWYCLGRKYSQGK